MTPWNDRKVRTFEEYVEQVKDILPSTASDQHLYWFRGQVDTRWFLEPALTRSLWPSGGADSPRDKEGVELEKRALAAFQARAHQFVSPSLLAYVRTTPCWWALMQHHGAPTRLLDWTISPYIAAYFAVIQGADETDGAVWAFCSKKLRGAFENKQGKLKEFHVEGAAEWYEQKLIELEDQPVVVPLEFKYITSERIAAQQGRFTMCFQLRQSHDCLISQTSPSDVRRIVIPRDKKVEFLLRLRDMNITGAALFPGVDGLGQSVKELVYLGRTYGQVISAQQELCLVDEHRAQGASVGDKG
jgi:hypothetical protein